MLLGKPVALLPNLFVPDSKLLTLLKMRMTDDDDDDDDNKQLVNFKTTNIGHDIPV